MLLETVRQNIATTTVEEEDALIKLTVSIW